ncbi:hypothetical protein B0T20DRAFT_391320 [Sordaria brevicollis]|uniref:Uncharacterized protein n=1 Tax=Sordaria brevicollis TaxID=83679 RepID=A0AAE0PGX1_SORBR|nr:hypothetical protein B0T20DRAFT_391320 [Sordaria brevicollis]
MSSSNIKTASTDQPNEEAYVPHKPFTLEFVKLTDEEDEHWTRTKHKLQEVHTQALKVFGDFAEELWAWGKKWEDTLKTLQVYKKRYEDLQDDFTTVLKSPMKSMVLLGDQQQFKVPLKVDLKTFDPYQGWWIELYPMPSHPWHANFKDKIHLDSADSADALPKNSSPEPDLFRVPRTRENPWGNPWFEVHHDHPGTLVPDYQAKLKAARAAGRAKDPKNLAYWSDTEPEDNSEPAGKAAASSSTAPPNATSVAATFTDQQQGTEPTDPAAVPSSRRAQNEAEPRATTPAVDDAARSPSSSPDILIRARRRPTAREKGKGRATDFGQEITATVSAPAASAASPTKPTTRSASGSGIASPKKDKSEAKAKAKSASRAPSASSSAAAISSAPVGNKSKPNKVTKSSSSTPAAAAQRATIKRSQVKKGKYWAFKAEQRHLAAVGGIGYENKFFVLACPAPELLGACQADTPSFERHPFKRNRAVEHFRECGVEVETEEEIFAQFAMEVVQDTARWPVNDEWARKHNRSLIGKRDADGDVAMEDLEG